jgi:putative redox protein
MKENTEEVNLKLINNNIQFVGISEGNPNRSVNFDYKIPIGDGDGFNGLELLLMSLSGCSATAVVYLLRKMRKEIAKFEVHSIGYRTTDVPVKFEKIELEFLLYSSNTVIAELEKCISLAEAQICPVWQMIKNNVVVQAKGIVKND